jgi:hypothetical protein
MTANIAVQAVTGALREHVENCRVLAESGLGGEAAYWGERGRLWALLADGTAAGLLTLLDMGVDIAELIEREVAVRAGEARLLAAIAALPDAEGAEPSPSCPAVGSGWLGASLIGAVDARIAAFDSAASPVSAFELVVDAQLAADLDTAGGDR